MVGGHVCRGDAWQGDMFGGGHVRQGGCVAGGVCMAGGMHGSGHIWQGACMVGGVHGRGHTWWGGMHGRGHAWQGACMAGETATAADGTHPTGMPSYVLLFLLNACLVALIFSLELLSEAQFLPYESLKTTEFSNLQGKELLMPSLPPIR